MKARSLVRVLSASPATRASLSELRRDVSGHAEPESAAGNALRWVRCCSRRLPRRRSIIIAVKPLECRLRLGVCGADRGAPANPAQSLSANLDLRMLNHRDKLDCQTRAGGVLRLLRATVDDRGGRLAALNVDIDLQRQPRSRPLSPCGSARRAGGAMLGVTVSGRSQACECRQARGRGSRARQTTRPFVLVSRRSVEAGGSMPW